MIRGVENIFKKSCIGNVREIAGVAGRVLIDIVYPPRCPLCEKIILAVPGRKRTGACSACIKKIGFIQSPRCFKCGKQLSRDEQEYCTDCRKAKHVYDRGVAALEYTSGLRMSLHRFKYKCRREYADFYAQMIQYQCGEIIQRWNPDVIMPVPMYAAKKRARGYNQAELIADRLGEYMHLTVDSRSLIRCRRTKAMKDLGKLDRLKNVHNAFKTSSNVLKYKKVLLVDDIYTTGTTIDACAAVLKRAGVQKVYYVSLSIGNGF